MLVQILFWVAIALTGGTLLLMIIFGIRSLAHGKISPLSAVAIAFPIILMVILAFVMGDWALAGIWTALIVGLIAVVGLVLSGTRTMFGW